VQNTAATHIQVTLAETPQINKPRTYFCRRRQKVIAIARSEISRHGFKQKHAFKYIDSENFFGYFGTRLNKRAVNLRGFSRLRPQPKRIKFSSPVTKHSVMKINARRRVCVTCE
jgi:hypothetical protein